MVQNDRADQQINLLISERPEFKAGWRALQVSDGLSEILHEIDTTVLGMRVTFASGPHELSLNLGHRRLISVASSNIADAVAIAGDFIEAHDPLTLDALATSVCTLAASARATGRLWVRAELLDVQLAGQLGQVSPALLRQAWDRLDHVG